MTFETLRAEVVEGVGHLTLDRPEAGNTIDLTMAGELLDLTSAWSRRDDVRCVLVRGAGATFCAGGDLKAFAARDDLPRHLTEITTRLHAAISLLHGMDAPIVAAVHGSAAGAGFSLACSCDVVLAAESARFVLAYGRVGLTPDGSGSWFLPRRVGLGRALELALLNRTLDAAEARDWGIVNQVVADSDLTEAAERLAAGLADGPTAALGDAKRLLRAGLDRQLEAQMAAETEALARAAARPEGREGIAAFLEKRSPRFR